MTAIGAAISRFDDDTKESFINLYSKVDADVSIDDAQDEDGNSTSTKCPF